MLIAWIISAASIAALGGQIVAAEARGESLAERARVGCVIANRAADPVRWRGSAADPWRSVMLADRQFADPHPARAEDVVAFVAGVVARPCGSATMFATPAAVVRLDLVERWGLGGFQPTIRGPHVYFERVD